MKKVLATLMCAVMLFSVINPALALGRKNTETKSAITVGNGKEKMSYRGDYVIAFNPSADMSNVKYSGTPPTANNSGDMIDESISELEDEIYPIDWLGPISKEDEAKIKKELANKTTGEKTTYAVGDIKSWMICSDLNTSETAWIDFRCIGVGENCYLWTANSSYYYPLDELDTSYAATVVSEFDSNYQKMRDAFGTHTDVDGTGKVHLMYYDLQDGWDGSGGFVGGYFWSYDMASYTNSAAMLHIDTYPQVTHLGLDSTFGTMFHEYQHLINFSRTGGMATWLNETMSMAAGEYIYPGSELPARIGTWNSASAYPEYHMGASQLEWNDSLDAYAIGCLFGQYLKAQTGDYSIFNDIITYVEQGYTEIEAIELSVAGTPLDGMTVPEILMAFRIATVVKASSGIYGFGGDATFDDVGIAYINGSANIYGCGGVVFKPAGGVYTVPDDADDGLVYVGISNTEGVLHDPTEIMLDRTEYSGTIGDTVYLYAMLAPTGAQDTVSWSSSNSEVASVYEGLVTLNGAGEAVITAKAVSGITATCNVKVAGGKYEVVSTKGAPGETVQVQVKLTDNAGIVCISYDVAWDSSVAELVGFENGTVMNDEDVMFATSENYSVNPYVVAMISASDYDYTTDGVLGTFTFRIKDDAPVGAVCNITVSPRDASNADMVQLGIAQGTGTITVTAPTLTGDANGDGNVNIIDAVMMLRKYTGWDIQIDEEAADIDESGVVDMQDIILLLRHLAGWEIEYFN